MFLVPPASIVAVPVASVSFSDSITSGTTDGQIGFPALAEPGDLAVAFFYASVITGSLPDVIPAGWTGLAGVSRTVSATTRRSRHCCKILTAEDISAGSITGITGSTEAKVMLTFRPDTAINDVTVSTWNAESTAADPASQTVTASGQSAPLIVFGVACAVQTGAAFSTASPAFDATVIANSRNRVGYKVYNASPANHTIDMNDLGSDNSLASGFIRVS
jgi:hypothetical protein